MLIHRRALLAATAGLVVASPVAAQRIGGFPAVVLLAPNRPWDLYRDLPPALRGALWDASYAPSITLNSGNVSAWTERWFGYSLAQATASKQPPYSATSLSGGPGLTTDGVDDGLAVAGAVPATIPTGGVAGEVFALISQLTSSGTAGTLFLWDYGSAANGFARRLLSRVVTSTVNRARNTIGNGASIVNADNNVVDLSGLHLTRSVYDGTNERVDVDGVAGTASAVAAATGTDGGLQIGSILGGASQAINATYSRLLFTKGALTQAQADVVMGWMVWDRYGLASLLPSTHPFRNRPPTLADGITAFGWHG